MDCLWTHLQVILTIDRRKWWWTLSPTRSSWKVGVCYNKTDNINRTELVIVVSTSALPRQKCLPLDTWLSRVTCALCEFCFVFGPTNHAIQGNPTLTPQPKLIHRTAHAIQIILFEIQSNSAFKTQKNIPNTRSTLKLWQVSPKGCITRKEAGHRWG
jgi:hypothetical protein